jgi:uncharacterized protein (TIGR02271 family)
MSGATPTATITDRDGIHGRVLGVFRVVDSPDLLALIETETGDRVAVPTALLAHQGGEDYAAPVSFAAPDGVPVVSDRPDGAIVIPVMEERLDVQRRQFETERVRVDKTVREREMLVDEPSWREELDVTRVERYEEVEGPLPPRQFGDETIFFLVEEEVVVTKRFVLKEEIHVRKRTKQGRTQQRVVLRKEEATVERIEPDGRPRS